ncbi:3173_t:CDS:2 [Dentiscutata erythropus]|uniref:3173_t:CDS:1 n=1 Tax=Dentiscutata erythropus TaxID=1348616 RepID=A0A9N9CG58_9GLOM|nr:3173_t:CDS:2 [Dentiscutata erythropus]
MEGLRKKYRIEKKSQKYITRKNIIGADLEAYKEVSCKSPTHFNSELYTIQQTYCNKNSSYVIRGPTH